MAVRYWQCLLDLACDCGAPPPGSDMQAVMGEVLIKNEFERLQDLRFAESPRRWAGVDRRSNEAVVFIQVWQRDVVKLAKPRYRTVCMSKASRLDARKEQ